MKYDTQAQTQRRPMTDPDFVSYGAQHMAYVRRTEDENGLAYWSIHAADGTQMGAAGSRELALAAIRQHDLEPLNAH